MLSPPHVGEPRPRCLPATSWRPWTDGEYPRPIARPIIIDTDPGQDDAVALLAALASPEDLQVLAITAVAGNVPLPLTVANSLAIVELAGRADIPVFAGAVRPMFNDLVTAEYVHGPTGLDGANLPPPSIQAASGHAVDRIIEILMSFADGAVTMCTLGPLTNLGMALVKEPEITTKIQEIVIMGGGFFEGGNTTPAAEFNIYVDPHAAHLVFTSGVPIVQMPLDVTHKALGTPERLAKFAGLGTPAGDAVVGMLDFYDRWDMDKYDLPGGPLHDPTVIAYLLEPEIFDGKEVHVHVETTAGATQGMTVIDWWGVTDQPPNATVMMEIDADRFFDLLVERIGRL